ncbi:MAG: aldehyde dehydrogenase family protein [Alphaproteobacteria bacterium]|nr:aldehyde dehydrogenase family protein [Alphaproteobacteria bacterium]
MSSSKLQVKSPVDGSIYAELALNSYAEVERVFARAREAQGAWRRTTLAERARICSAAVDAFETKGKEIAEELSWQMGRPVSQAPGEVRGFAERARYMIQVAPEALADIDAGPKENFRRFVHREPLGVVFTVAAWNYPYLIAVNSVIPAIMAGNAVVLKHSGQTPLCAERMGAALKAGGLPDGVFQVVHTSHADTEKAIRAGLMDFIAFTGSVAGGRAVQRAVGECTAGRFPGFGLELGGKDPAYVRADADLAHAVENLVDGAFFNSGQSCCGIERIYVDRKRLKPFVDGFVDLTLKYKLGDPTDPATNLGPMARAAGAETVRGHIADALKRGAKALVDEKKFPRSKPGTPYLAPQVLVEVDHRMAVMREESFGPVIGIMPVDGDDQAIGLMNDSDFGLTAAVWTADAAAAERIGHRLETGTVFMNRCDYLDPALAWTGVKESGRGCTLSKVGYEHLTRPKSFHLRLKTG